MSADGLTEFLLARIAEDKEVVRALRTRTAPRRYSRPWRAYLTTDEQGEDGITLSPARVLAECEAKRRVVEMWASRAEQDHPAIAAHATGLGLAIRALAEAYADHPDYREEWRP